MNNIRYTIDQVYDDVNINIKPYPYCPCCHKEIFLEVNNNSYITEPKYIFQCTRCNNYIYLSNVKLNQLCEDWNNYCNEQIIIQFFNNINNNILKIELGIFIIFSIFIYITKLWCIAPGLGLLIYLPFALENLANISCIKRYFYKHIIRPAINNKVINMNSIDIEKEMNSLYLINIIDDQLNYNYDYINYNYDYIINYNKIIEINKKNIQYYQYNYDKIDNEYINILINFYNTVQNSNMINTDKFYKYFYNKLNNINYVNTYKNKIIICKTPSEERIKQLNNIQLIENSIIPINFIYDNLRDNPLFQINNKNYFIMYKDQAYDNFNKNYIYYFLFINNSFQLLTYIKK